jgi:hypothetical protein
MNEEAYMELQSMKSWELFHDLDLKRINLPRFRSGSLHHQNFEHRESRAERESS